MLFHHLFGIAIICSTMASPSWPDDSVKKFIPVIGTIELSTIFMSAMWLIRETGNAQTKLFKVTIGLFAMSFFFTRICSLNYHLFKLWDNDDFKKLGMARYLLLGLSC